MAMICFICAILREAAQSVRAQSVDACQFQSSFDREPCNCIVTFNSRGYIEVERVVYNKYS